MNAKEELLEHTEGLVVVAVDMQHDGKRVSEFYQFRQGDNWDDFLDSLDWEYCDGHGTQKVFGTIWYADGTWSDREEYDGSEWWSHRERPEIPERAPS